MTTSTNFKPGQILTPEDCKLLQEEYLILKEAHSVDVATANYSEEWMSMAPWQRVELDASICGVSHDMEAIQKSISTGVRVY